MVRYAACPSPFGNLAIGWEDDAVVSLKPGEPKSHSPSPVSELAAAQLREYFAGTRKNFTFPIKLKGTPFQISVWQALARTSLLTVPIRSSTQFAVRFFL